MLSQLAPAPLSLLLLLLLSRFSRVRLCATPWTAAHQAPPSLGFSRQEHRSGLPTLMTENEEELKSLLIKVKEESKNVGFNLNIQITMLMKSAHHFMADRWGNNGNSVRL